MNILIRTLIGIALLATYPSLAQELSVSELRQRGELDTHSGYSPKTLESLVASSTLIVQGRYGDILDRRGFFGYINGRDDTLEEFMDRHDLTRNEAFRWDIPMTEYNIIVDAVLKGSVTSEKLTLRKYEPPPLNRERTEPDWVRLFFLVINPDNRTYALAGEASVLSLFDDKYGYFSFVGSGDGRPDAYEVRFLDFSSGLSAKEFEATLLQEISKQKDNPVNR